MLSLTSLELSLLGLPFVSLPLGCPGFSVYSRKPLPETRVLLPCLLISFQAERKGLSGPWCSLHPGSLPLGFELAPFGTGCHPRLSSPLLQVLLFTCVCGGGLQLAACGQTLAPQLCFVGLTRYFKDYGFSCQCLSTREFSTKFWMSGFS